jgi:predicted MPP superfamily phosphohydrolase
MTRREARLTRRTFLQKALAVVPLAAFGAGGQAVYEAQTALEVVRHTLVIPGLPAKLDGFRIGQISDTHLGPYFSLARLDYALGLMAAEKPDLVVMTGDFADDLSLLKEGAAALAALGAAVPHGVYFCWGNHEYFRDVAFIQMTLERAGIKQLKNAGALIVPGGRPFYLLGVDFPPMDNGRRGFEISPAKRREYFAATTATVPSDAFRVLIAHHPDFLYDGFAAGIPLTLAGHTHGGQVAVGGRPLIAFADYARGLYEENGVVGYVSSGAGHWFPFRFGCPPEISVFTLKA